MITSIKNRDQLIGIITELTNKEGWGVYDSRGSTGGDWQIQAHIDEGHFKDDNEAHEYVKMRACEGSIIHAAAIGIVCSLNPLEASVIFKL